MSVSEIISPQLLSGASFTTYRIGGALSEAYQPASEAELVTLLKHLHARGLRPTLLGWGGNTVIASQGIQAPVIITRKLDWSEPKSPTRLSFGAGVHLAKAASAALKQSLTGGEYMIGIPGTIGGAIRMNAGALAQETADLVRLVRIFNFETGDVEVWEPEQLSFSYRRSAIEPGRHVVLSAELEYLSGNAAEISRKMDDSVNFRKTHHPKEPNGGSVFKNPSKEMPVGRLMDELGAKGQWRVGGAMVSPLHGNFIVNIDSATSTDVLKLMLRMKTAIRDEYGLETHPENLFMGDATAEESSLWRTLMEEKPVS